MLQEMKLGTVKVALMLTLAASAYTVSNVQAQGVELPIPASDTELQQVVTGVRSDAAVKTMMNEVRAGVITSMTTRDPQQLPLRNQVQAKLMPIMMNKILPVQLQAMANPNGGFPSVIAPPPF
ncbi:MAG: hypothetical protein Q3M30_16045 [Candidatus Electrothrix sp. Rat3]|nr:hypothetical protein [Candidatus Electrothrix rattekaaiensis]